MKTFLKIQQAQNQGIILAWLRSGMILSLISHSAGYKAIFIVHGLGDNATDFDYLIQQIQEAHYGTEIFATNAYIGDQEFTPLVEQIKGKIGKEFLRFSKAHPEKFHLFGYSQGGLIARALIEYYANHNVHTFFSLAGMLRGVYGPVPDFPKKGDSLPRSQGSKTLYNKAIQARYPQSNWFKDPTQIDLYLKYNKFLSSLDNDYRTDKSDDFKKGFMKPEKFILIGGPDDGLLEPWQTEIFDFYNEYLEVVPYNTTVYYTYDLYGLRSVADRGAITNCVIPGVKHADWPRDNTAIHKCIIPNLT